MRATWYVTEDGKTVDPAECSKVDGVLTHKSGAKIEMRFPDCPRSRGVDVDAKGKALFGGKGDHDDDGKTGGAKQTEPAKEPEPEKKTTDMKAETKPAPQKKPGYRTRG